MIDAHCHLYEVPEEEWKDSGLEAMICAGADMETSLKSIGLAEKHKEVWATVGIHPEGITPEIFNLKFEIFNQFLNLTKSKKVVGIGECGLDSGSEVEIELFKFNIDLAKETRLPLVVHCRNQFKKIFEILDYDKVQMHCFTGNEEQMRECVRRGWYISFGGILTFKGSNSLREVAKIVPEDRLLVETDSPYLAPEPVRGSRNIPANVKIVARALAELRKSSVGQIEIQTTANARRLFTKYVEE